MTRSSETDVLVVGAGPVGLLSALLAAERGFDVRIIDKEQRTSLHSYALALHARSLAVLRRAGVADALLPRGKRLARLGLHEGSAQRAELDFSALGGEFPYVLLLPQSELESALEARLEALGVRVEWNHRLEELVPGAERATARIARLDRVATGYPIARTEWVVAESSEARAGFVVGADGYQSLVRRKLGIEQAALGGAQTFAVFEARLAPPPPEGARVQLDPDATSTYWPLPGDLGRFGFEVGASADPATFRDRLPELLGSRAPWFRGTVDRVTWTSVVSFDRRLAERFGDGNVALAGDAAHLAGPVGAQSMNVGLAEAEEIAAIAEARDRESKGPQAVAAYGAARLAEWRKLLSIGHRLRALPGADPWIERNAGRILPTIPASGPDLDVLLRQIGLEWAPSAA